MTRDAGSSRRRQLVAFNRAVKARGADTDPVFAAFVELGRTLARQLDASDGVTPAHVAGMYRQVLKELARMPAIQPPAAADGEAKPMAVVSALDEFRRRWSR